MPRNASQKTSTCTCFFFQQTLCKESESAALTIFTAQRSGGVVTLVPKEKEGERKGGRKEGRKEGRKGKKGRAREKGKGERFVKDSLPTDTRRLRFFFLGLSLSLFSLLSPLSLSLSLPSLFLFSLSLSLSLLSVVPLYHLAFFFLTPRLFPLFVTKANTSEPPKSTNHERARALLVVAFIERIAQSSRNEATRRHPKREIRN